MTLLNVLMYVQPVKEKTLLAISVWSLFCVSYFQFIHYFAKNLRCHVMVFHVFVTVFPTITSIR